MHVCVRLNSEKGESVCMIWEHLYWFHTFGTPPQPLLRFRDNQGARCNIHRMGTTISECGVHLCVLAWGVVVWFNLLIMH